MNGGDFENQTNPKEYDFESDLQRDRTRQKITAPAEKAAEKPGSNLNIVELILTLFLALGVDFGIGWLGGGIAKAFNAIPAIGQAASISIGFLVKFTTLATAMILWLWCLLRFKKLPAKRLGAATVIEVIPFIGELAPGWTAFVLSIIIKEKIMPMLQKQGMAPETAAKAIQVAAKKV